MKMLMGYIVVILLLMPVLFAQDEEGTYYGPTEDSGYVDSPKLLVDILEDDHIQTNAEDMIKVYSPISGAVITTKNVKFNITTLEPVETISYIDLIAQPDRESILCQGGTSCQKGYGYYTKKAISFREGYHNLLITGKTVSETFTKYVSFTLDSKAPAKVSIYPKTGGYTSGTFEAIFNEINPFTWSFIMNGTYPAYYYSWRKIDDLKTNLTLWMNLSKYNGKKISYSIAVKDKGNHSLVFAVDKVNVDTEIPHIDASYDTTTKRLNIAVSEPVTLTFYDLLDGKLKNICNKCSSSAKNLPLDSGTHHLFINAVDYARNANTKELIVDIP